MVLVLTLTDDLAANADRGSTDLQLRPELDQDSFTIEFSSPETVYYVKEPQMFASVLSNIWPAHAQFVCWTSKISQVLKLLV